MHKHNSARAAFRTSIIRCKMLCSAFHSLIINLAAKVRRIFGVCKLFAIFSYGVPKELCSNGESRGLSRPLIKWSGISHCDPSAECEVPLFPRGMKGTAFS